MVDFGYRSSRMVLVFGAEANEHVISKAADCFEWGEAMQALVAVDGPTALVVSDGDDHKRRRRLVQPAFSIKRVDAHLGLVVAEVDRALTAWQPGVQLDAAASLREAIRRIVVRALFGEELGAEADRFGELLEPGLRYVQKMPQQRFEHDLRVNPYARVQRSNRAADELVLAEVARRRGRRHRRGRPSRHAHRAAGRRRRRDPHRRRAARSGAQPDGRRLRHHLRRRGLAGAGARPQPRRAWRPCAPRSTPSSATGRRRSTTCAPCRSRWVPCRRCCACGRPARPPRGWSIAPSELHGMTIPAGRMVLYSAYVTGRLPELWPDPGALRPRRWAPGAPEPKPYSFVPFGGGYRKLHRLRPRHPRAPGDGRPPRPAGRVAQPHRRR